MWTIVFKPSNHVVFQCKDELHSVPIYEVHTNETLQFIIRSFLWCIPRDHEIYNTHSRSFENITVTNLIKELESYVICPGVTDKCLLTSSLIEHSVPKCSLFKPTNHLSDKQSFIDLHYVSYCPLRTNNAKNVKRVNLKRLIVLSENLETLKSPAKLKAPLSGTSTERIKLTLQGIRLRYKTPRAELQQMQAEVAANSLHITEGFLLFFYAFLSRDDNNPRRVN